MNQRSAEIKRSDSFTTKVLAGIAVAALGTLFGYFISYVDGRRKDQVAIVSQQIEKVYGPLYALTLADDKVWVEFSSKWTPRRDPFFPSDDKAPLDASEIKLWRLWINSVFQPLNLKMESAIVDNAQLIVGEHMPPSFIDFVAHVEAYKAVLAHWNSTEAMTNEERTRLTNTTSTNYPAACFKACIAGQFSSLKELRNKLQEQWFAPLHPFHEPVSEFCTAAAMEKEKRCVAPADLIQR